MIIHYQISFGQASANKAKTSDTERFKRRSTTVTVNSQWESQEPCFRLFTEVLLLALTWFYKHYIWHSREASGSCKAVIWLLEVFHIVTKYHKFLCQLKNAESILEYERMAEIGFEKRDFRMVSQTVVTILLSFVSCVVCHQLQTCQKTQNTSVLCLALGCFLHGPCLGVCPSLSQIQDTEGRVLSSAGALPWGSVCCQVGQHVSKDTLVLLFIGHYCHNECKIQAD